MPYAAGVHVRELSYEDIAGREFDDYTYIRRNPEREAGVMSSK